ncbi:putative secretory pathway protein sec39 [Golovinomyces cichoracearum]|uniref:Putative secretory pathway protein sec39 n=1 Tax=Golovinomyces cichoracearum TaxID=62708 RepID=A0A420IEY3_9PEZI|nr:putative secretory pathway protein sec39 [Golovinomyces cichoracearum]
MTNEKLSRAKIILSAANFASKANIPALQNLFFQHYQTLNRELFLRILLSCLPESLDPSRYVPLIESLILNRTLPESKSSNDTSALDEFHEEDLEGLVRRLYLLPLTPLRSPYNTADDPVLIFLIHRCLKIDESTGLISEIPALLNPFIRYFPFLNKWIISSILPLIRISYEYYPNDTTFMTIQEFEGLDDKSAVCYLLSNTGNNKSVEFDPSIGRDFRCLIGPWLHRYTRSPKKTSSKHQSHLTRPVHEISSINKKYPPIEETFSWVIDRAEISWRTAVSVIEGWDGPEDCDLGGYKDDFPLEEGELTYLKRLYVSSAIVTAYAISEESRAALKGIHRVLERIITLMGMGPIPSLESSCEQLKAVKKINSKILSQWSIKDLQLFSDEGNNVSAPTDISINFLHASLVSATLCDRLGCSISVKKAATLALQKNKDLQRILFDKLIMSVKNEHKYSEKFFVRLRNELLWLRSWGVEDTSINEYTKSGIGIFGQLSKECIEIEFLKLLLSNACYNLASSLYELSNYTLISRDTLREAVITAATIEYDGASNANISRGGLKRCNDILRAFPNTLSKSMELEKMEKLLQVTSDIGPYRLVLKKGEPFRPVNLRCHEDPILILGKILEQNRASYKRVAEFINMAKIMVQAGLIKNGDKRSNRNQAGYEEMLIIAESRIVSMCIDAALFEDDFEVAFSYVTVRLKNIIASVRTQALNMRQNKCSRDSTSLANEGNDWLWRAALQAGKYRQSTETQKFNEMRDASGKRMDIVNLEKRIDCISQALQLAPKDALQEILNVYHQCEEELNSILEKKTEDERCFQDDDQRMPGGFIRTPSRQAKILSSSLTDEEKPVSLFDLSRAGMMRAQSGLSAFSMLRGKLTENDRVTTGKKPEAAVGSDDSGTDALGGRERVMRKRDQLKNAAVGGLASGVGWLIGAPLPRENANDE